VRFVADVLPPLAVAATLYDKVKIKLGQTISLP